MELSKSIKSILKLFLTALGTAGMILIINVFLNWMKLIIPNFWVEFFSIIMGMLFITLAGILAKFVGD